MFRVLVALLAMGLGMALMAIPAGAATTTLTATADTFVNGNAPTSSFGTDTTMKVDDGFPKIAYVKFAAPTGTVTAATLRLYGAGAQSAVPFDVYKVPSTWTESTTYNTRPALGTKVGSGTVVANGYTDVVVSGVVGGTVPSFAIVRTGTGADSVFATRESANPPLLVVTTAATTPPTASFTYTPTSGQAPLTVTFDNTSTGAPTSYLWDFGDGSTSTAAEPGTHVYTAAGTYTVTLTATNAGGSNSTSSTVTVSAPPPPSTEYTVLGISDTEIKSIPIGTAAWNTLKAMADAAYTVDAAAQTVDGSANAVAGGLVYVRTGDASYQTKVNNALDAAQAVAPASWDEGAANRKMGGWIAAAQLVGRPARNADGSLNAWGTWVQAQMTVTHTGGVPRNKVMLDAARGWDNNHGAAARQSIAAIEAYLGLDMTASCNAMKAWLGGTFADYAFVASTTPGPNQMGWTDNGGAPSWYDSAHYSGVNPSTAWAGHAVPALKDGAIPADVERDGAVYPAIGAAGADHYVFGNLYREAAAMVTLAGNGCPLWTYADNALGRARAWAAANIPDHQGDYLGNADPVFNAVYGTAYPAAVGTGENMLAASEWLTSGPVVWPRR